MKDIFYYLIIGLFIIGCASTNKTNIKNSENVAVNIDSLNNSLDSIADIDGIVTIANDSLEYAIIIDDIGFEYYLIAIAQPMWYYPQSYLEAKNQYYVTLWNIRVDQPYIYNPKIYESKIHYDFNIDYGLEVNYKLYNYFKFVEYKYKQVF
jgi:hypothetical protein